MTKHMFGWITAATLVSSGAIAAGPLPASQRMADLRRAAGLPNFSSPRDTFVPRAVETDSPWKLQFPEAVIEAGAVQYRIENDGNVSRGNSGNWEAIAQPFSGRPVRRLLANPADPYQLYAQSDGPLMASSEDGGKTWVEIGGEIQQQEQSTGLMPLVIDNGDGYACTLLLGGRSLWKTADCGSTWQRLLTAEGGSRFTALAISERDGSVLAGADDGGNYFLSAEGNVVRSVPREGRVGSVAFDSRENCVAFAAYESLRNEERESPIYMTRNCGATWLGIGGMGSQSLPNVPVDTLALDPMHDRIYVTTAIGVFVSLDGGNAWSTEAELPAAATESFETDGELLLAYVPSQGVLAASRTAARCVVSLSNAQESVPFGGGSMELKVYATGDCKPWIVTGRSAFVTITSGHSGTGNGTVKFRVEANDSPRSRFARFTIAGRRFTITQAGRPCEYALTPNPGSVRYLPVRSLYDFRIEASHSSCQWRLTSNVTWLRFQPGSATGSRAVRVDLADNSGPSRTTTILFNLKAFSVTQPGKSENPDDIDEPQDPEDPEEPSDSENVNKGGTAKTGALLAAAAPRKGLQLVLLQCWGSASVERLNGVLTAGSITEIEIASSPYLDSACHLTGPASGRFNNLISVIDSLLKAGKKVRVTVHIGDLHDSSPDSSLETRAKQFWERVIRRYYSNQNVSFQISPSLEDEYTKNEFKAALDRLVKNLDYSEVKALVAADRFGFRRSANPGNEQVDLGLTRYSTYRDRRLYPQGAFAVDITYEFHRNTPNSRFKAWSNDGYLVYYSSFENHSNHSPSSDILDTHPRRSLSSFKSASYSGVRLLWRPAFNLFEKKIENGKVKYYRKDANGNTIRRRDTSTGKFDKVEADGLRQFLN